MIPSIAKDDPAFPQQHYWRGQIWPPQTLWTYLALKRAGEEELAWELAYQKQPVCCQKNGTEMVTVRKITAELGVNAPEHIIITGDAYGTASSGRIDRIQRIK